MYAGIDDKSNICNFMFLQRIEVVNKCTFENYNYNILALCIMILKNENTKIT